MDLDTLIIAAYVAVDDALAEVVAAEGGRLRRRGPAPAVSDAEALTMEAVGAFLGRSDDRDLFDYFRRHWAHFFPALARTGRTAFVRQCANLWRVREALWQRLAAQTPHDPALALVDSLALPVCRFARAPRCRLFRGQAAFGYDPVARQTFYGFRLHALVAWPGVIVRLFVAPADRAETDVLPDLARGGEGAVLGDRNYWSPAKRDLLAQDGLALQAPFKNKAGDPAPALSALMGRVRYRIDTVFGQLCDRFGLRRQRARDEWHLLGRLTRIALSHTLMVLLNRGIGNGPLELDALLTA